MNPYASLTEQGQSIWFDFIKRSMIWSGALYRMVREDCVRGVTSNPAIFEKAIAGSDDYGPALRSAVGQGGQASDIFERIAVQDIQLATDVLRPVYDDTQGRDGYVSLEVSPHLAYDEEGTVADALRLWNEVGRDNLMIKIPATPESLPAIERVLAEGVNVNVTLLFAVDVYEAVFERYMAGLEALAAKGGDVSKVASVASFFISRIDSLVDSRIQERIEAGVDDKAKGALEGLLGKVAIANAKVAYQSYKRLVGSDRWKALADKGAATQRLLWASTSTKNPAYYDALYVEELIGPDTVNTIPEATFFAFKDHGKVAPTLEQGLAEAEAVMAGVAAADISMKAVTDKLLADAVTLFVKPFDKLMSTVETKRRQILGERVPNMTVTGCDAGARLAALADDGFVRRLWDKDARLFGCTDKDDPAAAGFMGWLDVAERMGRRTGPLARLSAEVATLGVDHVVLMGMGGSSLAPEVFARTFGKRDGHPELLVLDSTVPAQVAALQDKIDLDKTAFIIASKSGTTTEPLSFDQLFFFASKAPERFYAVTDPGSKLEKLARERGYRRIFAGEPQIGGRYSVLSNFGMVAAAAMGADAADLLARARMMADSCGRSVPPADNPGVRLGAALGQLALDGKDKLTILCTKTIASLGGWLEQLVAESTGKHDKGIVPVDGERAGPPELYGDDRVFAYFRLKGDEASDLDDRVGALAKAGHPVFTFDLAERQDIVQEMMRWQIATATAGHVLGINPFDQPNVQESKAFTKRFLSAYTETGKLPDVEGERVIFESGPVKVYADEANAAALEGKTGDLASLLRAHLSRAGVGDYVALNAYLEMSEVNDKALSAVRHRIRDERKVATTLGFGPRFLHSTGQIHKGGPNSGVFLQITSDDAEDVAIPDTPYGFATLKTAQANGDFAALSSRGRRLLRLHLSADIAEGLAALAAAL